MTKIKRNDPCPCLSGRRYKHCCMKLSPVEREFEIENGILDDMMQKGYIFLENNKTTEACDIWVEFWQRLKPKFLSGFSKVEDADTVFSGLQTVSNWCSYLEMELGNAGLDDKDYYHTRIMYCSEFCSLFPKSDKLLLQNMKRAIAETYFSIDKADVGDKLFKELIEEFPDNIWSYIGWGDMYAWSNINSTVVDYEKAEQIYNMALGKNIKDESDLIDRLNDLKEEREKNKAIQE